MENEKKVLGAPVIKNLLGSNEFFLLFYGSTFWGSRAGEVDSVPSALHQSGSLPPSGHKMIFVSVPSFFFFFFFFFFSSTDFEAKTQACRNVDRLEKG